MGAARSRTVVLDAGALIEFERANTRMRALVRLAGSQDARIVIPAGALAQAWRDGARQARLAALVGSRLVLVEPLDEPMAKAAGALCGMSGTADVIDASVVLAARARDAVVVTTDPADLHGIDARVRIEAL